MGPMAIDPPSGAPTGAPARDRWTDGLAGLLHSQRPGVDRLGELRTRIGRALIAIGVCCVAAWFAYPPILSLLTRPLRGLPGGGLIVANGKLVFTAPQEAFFVRIKVVALTAAAAALPVVLWEAWRFLSSEAGPGAAAKPGGRARRRDRYAAVLIAASMALFAAGTAAGFAFVYPALHIFLYLGGPHVTLVPSAAQYLSFLLLVIVAFGVTFEYPLLLLGLIFAGVIGSDTLRRRRRLSYFLIIVVSAVVTPTVDPITPLALAIPLALLYEATIVTARILKR